MIGRKIIFKEVLDSTNNYVANLVLGGKISHGTVIMAGHQTAGKGQRGAVWEADPYQNLIFSTWLEHENLAVDKQLALTQCVSLALCDLLLSFGLSPKIKWPNDILIDSSKIAGILIENQLSAQKLKSSIVGIGLNVNQNSFGAYKASSMSLLKKQTFNVQEISMLLIAKLNERYSQLISGQFTQLHADYLNLLWLRGIKSTFEDKNGVFEGEIMGVDSTGFLILQTQNGIQTYQHKEIRFLERES